jgi:hypothetical protein
MSRKQRVINLPAPYLRRIAIDTGSVSEPQVYPFCLPLFKDGFAFDFKRAITIIVGETAPANRRCLKASLCWPGSTKRAAPKAIGRWIILVR